LSGNTLLLNLLLLLTTSPAEAQTVAQAETRALAGVWSVDLSARPDEPYFKSMRLDLLPDGRLSGSFYDSDIEAGRWTSSHGRLCVAFRTTDGVGPYHTAACLDGDRVLGQTWAEHRDFLFLWSADRPAPSGAGD
jgi:hypothetical protein